jgi:hypothetical protein
VALEWRAISPSVELLANPECRARCAVRDTGASGAKRFHWTVTVLGQSRPVAAGRTRERAEAQSLAEAALVDYSPACAKRPSKCLAKAEAVASVVKLTDRTTTSPS